VRFFNGLLDGKEFLSDLKVLAKNVTGGDGAVLDQLKTKLGKETFASMVGRALSGSPGSQVD